MLWWCQVSNYVRSIDNRVPCVAAPTAMSGTRAKQWFECHSSHLHTWQVFPSVMCGPPPMWAEWFPRWSTWKKRKGELKTLMFPSTLFYLLTKEKLSFWGWVLSSNSFGASWHLMIKISVSHMKFHLWTPQICWGKKVTKIPINKEQVGLHFLQCV